MKDLSVLDSSWKHLGRTGREPARMIVVTSAQLAAC